MALATNTKTSLANLTTLLTLDPWLCAQVLSSAGRLLQGAAFTSVKSILPLDANGSRIPAAQAAHAALVSDVAAG
jgi:hypothetical protein